MSLLCQKSRLRYPNVSLLIVEYLLLFRTINCRIRLSLHNILPYLYFLAVVFVGGGGSRYNYRNGIYDDFEIYTGCFFVNMILLLLERGR